MGAALFQQPEGSAGCQIVFGENDLVSRVQSSSQR